MQLRGQGLKTFPQEFHESVTNSAQRYCDLPIEWSQFHFALRDTTQLKNMTTELQFYNASLSRVTTFTNQRPVHCISGTALPLPVCGNGQR